MFKVFAAELSILYNMSKFRKSLIQISALLHAFSEVQLREHYYMRSQHI
jgi:hypothetical protein